MTVSVNGRPRCWELLVAVVLVRGQKRAGHLIIRLSIATRAAADGRAKQSRTTQSLIILSRTLHAVFEIIILKGGSSSTPEGSLFDAPVGGLVAHGVIVMRRDNGHQVVSGI